MADRPPGNFGRSLREARERRGVSLRQIANSTKIGMSALEALERNDISRLPGGIFSRGFVRSYAREVGLDPEATIQEFIAQFPHDSVTAGHPASTQSEDPEAIDSERRTAATFMRLVALSVPIAGVMIYFGIAGLPVKAPDPDAQPAVEVEPTSAPAPVPVSTVPALQSASTNGTAPGMSVTADRLSVSLSALRECWVSVTVDGVKAFDSLLQPGDRRSIDAQREVVLKIGDASALAIKINGIEARPFGRQGEVVTTHLNLANFRDHLLIP